MANTEIWHSDTSKRCPDCLQWMLLKRKNCPRCGRDMELPKKPKNNV